MMIQKFHPGIQLGRRPRLMASRYAIFSQQGHWDGGSPLHCLAMALTLLGKLTDPRHLPHHKTGNECLFWELAWPHYLHGLTFSELACVIAELNLHVQPALRTGHAPGVLTFCERELAAGRPIIVGWRQSPPIQAHTALVIGIEGQHIGRAFMPHALLLLDPADCEPGLAGFNARLDWRENQSVRYLSATSTRRVKLEGAMSVRPRP